MSIERMFGWLKKIAPLERVSTSSQKSCRDGLTDLLHAVFTLPFSVPYLALRY